MNAMNTTTPQPNANRAGEFILSDTNGSRVRIFQQAERFVLTADREEGGTIRTFQVLLSPDQYAHLARFSSEVGLDHGPVEIERKWLLDDARVGGILAEVQSRESSATSVVIKQGYLVVGDDEVRLRRKGESHFLTLKSSGGIARCEVEVEISPGQFEELWRGTEGSRLEKTRTSFPISCPHGGTVVAEIDQFYGTLAPLAVVECEFVSEAAAQSFAPPSWFGAEVTEERAYKNKSLVRDGIPRHALAELRAPRCQA